MADTASSREASPTPARKEGAVKACECARGRKGESGGSCLRFRTATNTHRADGSHHASPSSPRFCAVEAGDVDASKAVHDATSVTASAEENHGGVGR
jgi:hypothetical protein